MNGNDIINYHYTDLIIVLVKRPRANPITTFMFVCRCRYEGMFVGNGSPSVGNNKAPRHTNAPV